MNRRILILSLAALTTSVRGESAIASPHFRNIHIHVTDVQGKPASNRRVDLIGLERWSIEPSDDRFIKKYWHRVTDRNGNVVFHIGDFAGWLGNEVRPGWGVYAVVVEPGTKDAGGVSSRFWFDNAPSHHYDFTQHAADWAPQWGSIVPVPAEGLDVAIRLQSGFTLKGQVVDDQHPEIPLAGAEIRTMNDLCADTHTGMGGEIFHKSAKTDVHGDFVIPHLFPNTTYVDLGSAIWLKTRIGGKWMDEVGSDITAPKNGEVTLEIGATTTPRFKYSGRVVDANNQPVANAQINLYLISHSKSASATWGEEHDPHQTTTRADGTYEYISPTPWVIEIDAEISNRKSTSFKKTTDDQVLAPGEYNVIFSPK